MKYFKGVFTGLPDEMDLPLASDFTITRQNKDEDNLDVACISNKSIGFDEELEVETKNVIQLKNLVKLL